MKSILSPQATKESWEQIPRSIINVIDQLDPPADQITSIEAIIDAIHEPVIILDKNLLITSVNKALLKKFKVTKKSLLEKEIFPNSNKNKVVSKLRNRLKKLSNKNASFGTFELTYPFEKLGEKTFLINAKRIHFGKIHADVILLSLEDITQRKMIERQKDDFVGYVTHELKTPITSISAFVQLLQGYHTKTGDKKSQFLLAKIAGQLDQLVKLLNSFTHVYQAQTGKLILRRELIDLYEVVRETVEMFQYTTATHMISIEGAVAKPLYADKERIRQVIINLLINAIKYSPMSDTILVKMHEEAKNIVVSVQDFGPGIPKEIQTHIFERFFRVRDNQSYNVKGLGLGLYISLEIIKAHKGKLWVTSTEGKGSTFLFSLPIKTPKEKKSPSKLGFTHHAKKL